jgi:hypothetical protein
MPIEAHIYLPKNEIIYNLKEHRVNVGDGTWLADLNYRTESQLIALNIVPITIADIEAYDPDTQYVGSIVITYDPETDSYNGSYPILDKSADMLASELVQYKKSCIATISNEYDNAISNGTSVTCNNETFIMQIQDKDISKVDGVLRFAQMTGVQTVYLTDINNVNHYNIAIEDAQNVLIQMFNAALSAHYIKQQKRDAVMLTTDIKQLKALMTSLFTSEE